MSSIILTANRKYPSIPEVGGTIESHTRALEAIVESIQIHERRISKSQLDSFVRVRELESLGLVTITGDLVLPVTAEAAGGSNGYLVYTYVQDETTCIDTNAPVARRFFLNTHRFIQLFDLSNFTQCRLVVNKQGIAGDASYQLSVEYRAAGFSTSVANYVDIGTSAVSCACNVTNTIVDSGWVDLAAGAIADNVAVCITGEGGNGVLDPQFGSVVIQFR